MASKVSIANRALQKLGEDRILLLTDDNKAARTMNGMFDDVRDAELRRHNWKFAMARTSLVALAEAPAWGYAYQYPLPADFLKLVTVNDLYVQVQPENKPLWQVEGGKILTDLTAPLKIRYVRRVTDTGLFDPLFVEALASKLAYEACETLTQSAQKKQSAAEDYRFALSEARKTDAIENPPDRLQWGSWLDSRLDGPSSLQLDEITAYYPSGFSVG